MFEIATPVRGFLERAEDFLSIVAKNQLPLHGCLSNITNDLY